MLTHSFSPLGTSTLLVSGPPPKRPDPDVAVLRHLTVLVFVAAAFRGGRVVVADFQTGAFSFFSRSAVEGSWLDRIWARVRIPGGTVFDFIGMKNTSGEPMSP